MIKLLNDDTVKELLASVYDEQDMIPVLVRMSDIFTKYEEYLEAIKVINDVCGYNIDNTVYYTGNRRFSQSGIEKVKILDSVTKIDKFAFADCLNLKSVDFGYSNITEILEAAFYDCKTLNIDYFPQSIRKIDKHAFRLCGNIDNLNQLTNIVHIEYAAFANSKIICNFDAPQSLRWIGGYAFYMCKNMQSINLKENCTRINKYAFFGCTGLNSATLPKKFAGKEYNIGINPDKVKLQYI